MSAAIRDHVTERFRPAWRGQLRVAPAPDGVARGFFQHEGRILFGRSAPPPADGADRATIPFDPRDVIDNLRLERYTSRTASGVASHGDLVRRMYYLLRPAFPVWFRKHLQRRALADWEVIQFPRWPVDLTVDELLRSLLLLEMEATNTTCMPFVWFWPRGLRGCITITHDVETAKGRDAAEDLAALDLAYGFRSSFQFIPETRYVTPAKLREALRSMGAEVNLHGLNHDGHLFDNEDVFAERAARINTYGREFGSRGFRSPVMYRNPDWFHHLEFDYDMSIPNVAHLDPQRGGCCTVFPYFIGDMLELPLTTIQDYSLFHVLGDYSIDVWRKQMGLIAGANGMASFNVHPDYVASDRERAVYVELLQHLQSQAMTHRLWSASPGEIATWWRDRSEMTLVETGDGWQVVGRSSEAACVAYAQRSGRELTFRFEP